MAAFAARLKSCPDTYSGSDGVFPLTEGQTWANLPAICGQFNAGSGPGWTREFPGSGLVGAHDYFDGFAGLEELHGLVEVAEL